MKSHVLLESIKNKNRDNEFQFNNTSLFTIENNMMFILENFVYMNKTNNFTIGNYL